jgi:sec-independent protein translocase protein TatA
MGWFHTPELLIILFVALIFLGPKRLPEAGKSLGRAIRGFKDETQGLHEEVKSVADTVKDEAQHVRDKVLSATEVASDATHDAAPTSQRKDA